MGKVNIGWNPKYASKTPQPNKVPKYSDTGVLKSETPDKYDSNDSVVNIDYLDKYINGPKSIDIGSTVSQSASALCTVNTRIFIGSTNKVESFFSTGAKERETTANMENATLVPAITECGNDNILTAKGNALIETSYYLTTSYKRLMFSDTDQYITAVATYDLGSSVVVAIGTNTGKVGLFKYKPGSSTDFISSYAFTSTVESTSPNTTLDITNKLYIYNNNPITDILLTSDKLIIGNSNTSGTIGSASIFSYSISSSNTSIILVGSVSATAGREVGIDLVDNGTDLIIAFMNGSYNKYILDNPNTSGMSYNQQRPGIDLIDMVTDNDENIYLLYSDGLLRKVNYADVKLWDYQTKINGIPLSMSIDKDNHYIVVCNTNGQFEIISYMTGKNLVKSTESALMMLKAQVLPGDYIKKIEVCQLNGTLELDGDITGSVDLKADNSCLIDPDDDPTVHKIKIDTRLSDNCASNIMIYKGIVGAITTESYEDELSGWTDIAYGETSEGGIFVGIKSLSDVAGYTYDGKTWYETSLPGKLEWTAVTYGNGKFVAIAKNTGVFASSTDGIRWTKYESLFANHHWVDIAFGNDRFLVISKIGASAYSTDGENWIYDDTLPDLDINDDHVWVSLTYGDRGFLAISTKSSVAALTEDGTNWRTVSLPSDSTDIVWRDVAFSKSPNNFYLAIGNDSNGDTKSAASNDGVNWAFFDNLAGKYDWSIIRSYENMFIAAGKNVPYLAFKSFKDNSTWDYIELPEESYDGNICCGISAIACGNGILVGSVELSIEEGSVSRTVKRNYVGYNTMDLPIIHRGGWTYKAAKAGTYAGVVCEEGDFITCIKSGDYKDDDHWSSVQANVTIGNKTTAGLTKLYTETGDNTDGTMTQSAITKSLNNLLAANDAMIFKGTIGTGGTVTELPKIHEIGWTYRVITAGTYAGVKCEVGDLIICVKDGTTVANSDWTVAQTNIDGAVTGPTSVTGDRIAVFNGTSGKIIKDGGYSIETLKDSIDTIKNGLSYIKLNNSDGKIKMKVNYREDNFGKVTGKSTEIAVTGALCINPYANTTQSSTNPPVYIGETMEKNPDGTDKSITAIHHGVDSDSAGVIGLQNGPWGRGYISVIYTNRIAGSGTTDPNNPSKVGDIYVFSINGTEYGTTSSDRRIKNNISYQVSDKYRELFKRLQPVSYTLDSDKEHTHIGFIAQDVCDALIESGIDYKTMGVVVENDHKKDDTFTDGILYSLYYNEFTALNTAMIQDLQKENEELKSRIAKLEELVDSLINK